MCDINSTSFYPEPSLGQKLPFIDVKRQIRGRMITVDFDSLKSRARKCLDEARYWWLAIVLLEVIFLAAVCAKLFWPSPESREFLKLASIAVVVGLAYSFFGIRQCLNANKSELQTELDLSKRKLEKTEKELYVCYDLLGEAKRNFVNAEVSNDRLRKRLDRELEDAHKETNLCRYLLDEAKRRFVNAEASNDRLKKSLRWSLTNCRKLRKELATTKRELEDTQEKLGLANLNADNALYARDTARDIAKGVISERNGLRTERDGLRTERDGLRTERDELLAEIDKLKRENFALREELGDTDDALVESCSQLASVCSKLDDLQSKLSKLVAERNQLQAEVEAEINNLNKKLTAANAGFQWYQGECISAKRRVNHAKQQIADLEGALKKAISALPKETHGDE